MTTVPDLDRELSPHTGLTRAHWLAAADELLEAVAPYRSPGGGRYRLPGPASWSGRDSDELEGFARTFLLAALRMAGGQDGDSARTTELAERYAAGLAAGTDPSGSSREAWPEIGPDCKQALVEAASVAGALHLSRRWLWDLLPAATQQQVVGWLSTADSVEVPDTNWHYFPVVVGEFLRSVGAPVDEERSARHLARIEELYVRDGWYRDGPADNFDHYCGWAMQVYPVLLAHMRGAVGGDGQVRLGEVAARRLHDYLADHRLLVGGDGAPLHQGRSLIYRFAAAAAPWAGALAGATPLTPGQTRRLASGMLAHFRERGFTGPDGVPTLGWYDRPFPPMVQHYSGPGSPFWLAKGFLGLLLPADHPVWTDREEPLPVEQADTLGSLPAPGWLVSGTRPDGVVRVVNHGADHHSPLLAIDDPHYSRFAYSTVTGPLLGRDGELADNHVGLRHPDHGLSRRRRIHRLGQGDDHAASWHRPVWPELEEGAAPEGAGPTGARIETQSVVAGPWEVRASVVRAPAGWPVEVSGWQLAAQQPPVAAGATDQGPGRWLSCRGPSRPAAGGEPLVSVLGVLLPTGVAADVRLEAVATEETSAFGPRSMTPVATWQRDRERTVHVAVVGLGRGLAVPVEAFRCEVDEQAAEVVVRVRVPDGRRLTLRLAGPR